MKTPLTLLRLPVTLAGAVRGLLLWQAERRNRLGDDACTLTCRYCRDGNTAVRCTCPRDCGHDCPRDPLNRGDDALNASLSAALIPDETEGTCDA